MKYKIKMISIIKIKYVKSEIFYPELGLRHML